MLKLASILDRRLQCAVGLILFTFLSGCSNIGYLYQAAKGHLEVMSKAEPIEDVLAREGTSPALARQLRYAQQIRTFSVDFLAMPDNKSYRNYVDLGRGAVVWNVIATPADSLEPRKWCYPFFGCVSYKGFYSQDEAKALAKKMRIAGDDVFLTGIPAYSTLGLTPDPLLNTFIFYPPGNLARMIFHELAHQVVYIDDDTMFNESFATAVEELGARAWLARLAEPDLIDEYSNFEVRRQRFKQLLAVARQDLLSIYENPVWSTSQKIDAKKDRFAALLVEYEQIKRSEWNDWGGYDDYMYSDLNNAKVAMAGLYNEYVPSFKVLFAKCNSDFTNFYEAVRRLGERDFAYRTKYLDRLVAGDVSLSLDCQVLP